MLKVSNEGLIMNTTYSKVVTFIYILVIPALFNQSIPDDNHHKYNTRDCIEDDFNDCCEQPFDVWFDSDDDGLGDPNTSALTCSDYFGWVENNSDPDDNCYSNFIDCLDVCDGTAYYDACDYCDDDISNDDQSCTGCLNEEAINYDPDALFDSGNCIYPSDNIWHVSVSGSDEIGIGTIDNPFESILHTIEAAFSSDTILVHPGIYYENINYSGKNLVICSMNYFTNDTSFIPITVINGGQNSSVVTFENGEDSTAILAGFTITNGLGGIISSTYYGGGVTIINDSNPLLENLVVTNNTAFKGGGIMIQDSSPNINNSKIVNNSSMGDVFSHGGGIFSKNSNLLITDVEIIGNLAGFNGGGFYNRYGEPTLRNVKIIGNATVNAGGGVSCGFSEANLTDCLIANNSANNFGGGIIFWMEGNLIMDHVIFVQNYAPENGFMYSNSSSPQFINVTISDNISDNNIDFGIEESPNLIFVNSIFWDDAPYFLLQELNFEYCDILGYNLFGNNISEDPMFVDPSNLNYSLAFYSPCIDSGTSDFENELISIHLDSNDYNGFQPDIGAIESNYTVNNIGDINDDYLIDILDLISLVDIIIYNLELSEIEFWLADLNEDGLIDVLDIFILIELILYN